jgi:hypothetical protein
MTPPNRLWVAPDVCVDVVRFAYVAFVVDAHASHILGGGSRQRWRHRWSSTRSNKPSGPGNKEGPLDLKDVAHHTDQGSHYISIRFSERLAEPESSRRPEPSATATTRWPRRSMGCARPRDDQTPQALADCRSGLSQVLRSTSEASRRLSSHIRKSPDSPGRFRYKASRSGAGSPFIGTGSPSGRFNSLILRQLLVGL